MAESMWVSEIIRAKKQIIPLFNLDEYSNQDIKRIAASCQTFSENTIYPSMDLSTYRLLGAVFENYQSINFLSLFEYASSNELTEIIPKTWRLFKFTKKFSKRLIEFSHGEVTIINKDNPFLTLILRNKNAISGTQRLALSRFFDTLKFEIKRDFTAAQKQHEEIIRWFVDMKVVDLEEARSYVITKNDFPEHLL